MLAVALAILPIVAAIAVGYGLKHRVGLPQVVWAAAEKSVFFLFLPALVFHHIAIRDVGMAEVLSMMLPICAIIIGLGVVAYWSARWLTRSQPSTAASVHQASIRLNGVVMIALIPMLLGDAVWPYVVVMSSIWPALSNTTSILVYVQAAGVKRSPVQVFVAVLKNPMVVSVAAGALCNVIGLGPYIEAFGLFELLGKAALPIGLLAAGAGLEFSSLRRTGPPTLLATVLKLAAMPALVWWMCSALGLSQLITQMMVISSALPCSPSAYVLATQMHGDAQTVASAITLQHVVGMISVALWAGWVLAG